MSCLLALSYWFGKPISIGSDSSLVRKPDSLVLVQSDLSCIHAPRQCGLRTYSKCRHLGAFHCVCRSLRDTKNKRLASSQLPAFALRCWGVLGPGGLRFSKENSSGLQSATE